jgi:cell division protein FtsA
MASDSGRRLIVGLDIGTSKVAAIVGEITDDGGLDIIGIGLADSRGIRRGVVVNLEAAVESIKKAIEEAELTAGIEIDAVHLGLSGAHMNGVNSRGVVAVAGKNREIMREDVRRALDAAKAVTLPAGREIIHVLPQDFVVDEQDGIGAPVGMTGSRLEVNVHVVTGSASSTQNVVACVNRAGVAVQARSAGRRVRRGTGRAEFDRESGARQANSCAARHVLERSRGRGAIMKFLFESSGKGPECSFLLGAERFE